jgi:hypothetical protein
VIDTVTEDSLNTKYNFLRRKTLSKSHTDFNVLGVLEKLGKPTTSFVMSVRPSICLSIRMEQLCSHWKNFCEILYLSTLRKYAQKVRVVLKSDKNKVYFTWRLVYIYRNISLISS